MASDSRFLDAVGFAEVYDVTDEGGWLFEALPTEDIGFAVSARVETELDLLPPAERELRELAWLDLGFDSFRELEDLHLAGAQRAQAREQEGGGADADEAEGGEGEEGEFDFAGESEAEDEGWGEA